MFETARLARILADQDGGALDDAGVRTLGQKIGQLPKSADEAFAGMTPLTLPGLSLDQLRTTDNKSRFGFLVGAQDARRDALREMDKLRSLPVSSAAPAVPSRAQFLSQLKRSYEERSTKHIAFCERKRKVERQ